MMDPSNEDVGVHERGNEGKKAKKSKPKVILDLDMEVRDPNSLNPHIKVNVQWHIQGRVRGSRPPFQPK